MKSVTNIPEQYDLDDTINILDRKRKRRVKRARRVRRKVK